MSECALGQSKTLVEKTCPVFAFSLKQLTQDEYVFYLACNSAYNDVRQNL